EPTGNFLEDQRNLFTLCRATLGLLERRNPQEAAAYKNLLEGMISSSEAIVSDDATLNIVCTHYAARFKSPQPAAQQMTRPFCSKGGSKLRAGARCCTGCGSPT